MERPNILLIIADDLGAWMLGCYGNREFRTPNIDRLAQTGTRFAYNFVCTPAGSASLATLLSGRLPRQTGIYDFLTAEPVENPPQGQAAAPASFRNEVLLSDLLAGLGYHCGHIGKWALGDERQPQHHYAYWYTALGDGYANPRMSSNGQEVEEKGYLTELTTQQACGFIDQQTPDKPFFLSLGYFNPRPPYEGHPQKYYDLYAATKFETIGYESAAPNALRNKDMLRDPVANLRKCAASVTALDDQIPVLLSKLQQKRVWDKTLIVFCGENGALLGRHGLWDAGLASSPINMYDEVIRVPMIWSWLGQVPAQSVRNELISTYDLLPTICDLLSAPLPSGRNYCGRSYALPATGKLLPKKQPWRSVVFGEYRSTEMIRDTRYKLIEHDQGKAPGQFFDLRNDPGERTNHYMDERFVSARDHLRAQLAAWRKQNA